MNLQQMMYIKDGKFYRGNELVPIESVPINDKEQIDCLKRYEKFAEEEIIPSFDYDISDYDDNSIDVFASFECVCGNKVEELVMQDYSTEDFDDTYEAFRDICFDYYADDFDDIRCPRCHVKYEFYVDKDLEVKLNMICQ